MLSNEPRSSFYPPGQDRSTGRPPCGRTRPREDGGTTQDAFYRIAIPTSLRTIVVAFQPQRPSALRHRIGFGPAQRVLRATSGPAHRFARARVCSRASAEPPSPRLSPKGLPLRLKPGPFSEPTAARASGYGSCFRLSCAPALYLAAGVELKHRRVATDLCFPLLENKHPISLRGLPASLRGLRLARYRGLAPVITRPVDLAVHDAGSASAGSIRFHAVLRCSARPDLTIPLASLSLPDRVRAFQPCLVPACRGRSHRPSVKSWTAGTTAGCLPSMRAHAHA